MPIGIQVIPTSVIFQKETPVFPIKHDNTAIISPMTEAMLPNVFKLIILQITTFFFLAFYDILIKFDMGSCDRYWSV